MLPQLEPEVADFLVLIGPAVSWQAQGEYYTRTRLAREGRGTAEIEQRLRDEAKQDEILFSADRPPADLPVGMTPARWRFIRINRTVDASADLAAQACPFLEGGGERSECRCAGRCWLSRSISRSSCRYQIQLAGGHSWGASGGSL